MVGDAKTLAQPRNLILCAACSNYDSQMQTYLLSAFAANNLSAWVAAGFTLLAVVAALYVASAATRRENKRLKSAATLMAARVSPLLERDALIMARAVSIMEFLAGERLPSQSARVSKMAVVLRELTFNPDDALLLALVPLDMECAHKISRAYGIVQLLNTEIDAETRPYGPADNDTISRWEGAFLEVFKLLRDAAETCKRHGQVVARDLPKSLIDGIHA